MNKSIYFVVMAVFVLQTASAYSTTLQVSPGGAINSLSAARDRVRELRQLGTNDDIIVEFQSGTYVETNTVIFGLDDSAPTNARTIYRAAPGATPVISGGRVISNWEQVTSEYPDGLPASAKGNLWRASVPWATNDHAFSCLFEQGRFLTRSISASAQTTPSAPDDTLESVREIQTQTLIKNWPNLSDIEVRISPKSVWFFNYLPIESVDLTNQIAWLAQPASKQLDGTYYIENAIDYLDEAGEWVLNTSDGVVYYWPESGAPTNVIVPFLKELVRVEGTNDEDTVLGEEDSQDVAQDVPVRGLVFEGLTFTHADRYKYEDGDIGLQHDWDLYDKASGLLRFRGAEDCVVTDCTFRDSGSGGVRMDLYCQNIIVENSLFQNLGGTGILLSGYGPGRKDVNHSNTIINNTLLDSSQIWDVAPAIFIEQSGHNYIAHNRIENTGYNAMTISGFRTEWMGENPTNMTFIKREEQQAIRHKEILWNVRNKWVNYEKYIHTRHNIVRYNEIHDAGNLVGPGSCIYISGTGPDNLIQFNAFYDKSNTGGMVYIDTGATYVKMIQNILFGTESNGILMFKGSNQVEDNLFINATFNLRFQTASETTFCRNIFYHSDTKLKAGFHDEGKVIDYDLYWHCVPGLAATYLAAQQLAGADSNSIAADPLFLDYDNANFGLETNSPALDLGINIIPADEFAKIGTLYEPFRERLLRNKGKFLYNIPGDDTDTDGLRDEWELYYFGNLDQGATGDPDNDGDENLTEFTNETNPTEDIRGTNDSDNDGIDNRWETLHFGSTVARDGSSDSDHDGSQDFFEYLYGSDPADASSRGFGLAAGMHDDGTSVACDWSVREGFVLSQHYGVAISSNLVTWDALPGQYNLNQSTNSGMTKLEVILPDEYGPSAFFKFTKP